MNSENNSYYDPKEVIISGFREFLLKKFKGQLVHVGQYNNAYLYGDLKHIIQDVRIDLYKEDWEINGGGGSFSCYKIEFFVTTLQGNNGRWVNFHLF